MDQASTTSAFAFLGGAKIMIEPTGPYRVSDEAPFDISDQDRLLLQARSQRDMIVGISRALRKYWNLRWPSGSAVACLEWEGMLICADAASGIEITRGGQSTYLEPADGPLMVVSAGDDIRYQLNELVGDDESIKFVRALAPDDVINILAGQRAVVMSADIDELTGLLAVFLQYLADSADEQIHLDKSVAIALSDDLLSNLTWASMADVGGHLLPVTGNRQAPTIGPFVAAPESQIIPLLDLVSQAVGRGGLIQPQSAPPPVSLLTTAHAKTPAKRETWRQLREREYEDAHRRSALRYLEEEQDQVRRWVPRVSGS